MIQSIIGKIRGLFRPHSSSPIREQEKLILIYLFCKRDEDRTLYDLWIDATQTDRTLTEPEIRKMLTKDQYKLFLKGEVIFEVPERKVLGKEEQKRLTHKPFDSSAYDIQKGIIK